MPKPGGKITALRLCTLLGAFCGALPLLAPFLYALAFCFPQGDDFDEITRAMFLFDLPGALYEAVREWLGWSGRFTYHFLAVFLARAAESRLLYGLVCGGALALNCAGLLVIARQLGCQRGPALLLGLLGVAAICLAHAWLPIYYLLTDALTTGLQGAILLFFWAALIRLCRPGPIEALKRAAIPALIWGALAIGVYEHAALAVFWSLAAALAWTSAQRPRQTNLLKVLRWLLIMLTAILLLSFLAPGNFQRASSRGVDAALRLRQLADAPGQWLEAQAAFWTGLWPWAAATLGLGLGALCPPGKLSRPLAATLSACAYLAFSCCLAVLQALSDAPLVSSPKLGASLGLFTALALGVLVFQLSGPISRRLGGSWPYWLPLLSLMFWIMTAFSANFARVTINAVNGELALYGQFMEKREEFLRQKGERQRSGQPLMGLWAEIKDPAIRRPVLLKGLPQAAVPRLISPVFPVCPREPLAEKPDKWPNIWAARVYGLGGVAALPPDPRLALEAVASGEATELSAGRTRAWRVDAEGLPGFELTWLIFSSAGPLPANLSVFRPNPLLEERFAPMTLQTFWLIRLLEQKELTIITSSDRLAGVLLPLGRGGGPAGHAIPLGLARPAESPWPVPLYLGAPGSGYLRLEPFRH